MAPNRDARITTFDTLMGVVQVRVSEGGRAVIEITRQTSAAPHIARIWLTSEQRGQMVMALVRRREPEAMQLPPAVLLIGEGVGDE